jgi:stalled ribosome alternative rescue factor ArfA
LAVTSHTGRATPKNKPGRKLKFKKAVKRRSAAAAALATPVFRKRVVKSAKAYSRKSRARAQGEESEEA